MTRIRFVIGDQTLTATLDDTPTARDFAALLPLELTLRDYADTEKVADLPRELTRAQAPSGHAARAGEITYYTPWGNLAIFYRDFRRADGLIRLGSFDGDFDALTAHSEPFEVRIELAPASR